MAEKKEKKRGMIHLYAGDGKGKTTAATGLTVRAAGRDWRVLFVQFLKSGNSAELKILRSLPTVKVVTGQKVNKFSFHMTAEEKETARNEFRERLEAARAAAEAGEVDLLVLDEALGTIQAGLLDEDQLYEFMAEKPEALELVITGRDPSPRIIELADYYSEICERKHPYRSFGLNARPGIEF
ncbi:MAG: cob(I)yrinic acid a,c-diamide adenosyltransferase [Eubacteriales bacterium]|nr:cob(I)yrinic acid a,c-diamide adenosyltransferase [Eubacteriales bacterium]